jgi:hypothetical protein
MPRKRSPKAKPRDDPDYGDHTCDKLPTDWIVFRVGDQWYLEHHLRECLAQLKVAGCPCCFQLLAKLPGDL